MSRTGRMPADPGPRNPWYSTLDAEEHARATQAGEVDPGTEEGHGGGDKGRDADTGSGGYSGDAVEAGVEEADAEADRPLDAEIHGDPRTHEGHEYPEDLKRVDPDQPPIGKADLEEPTEPEE